MTTSLLDAAIQADSPPPTSPSRGHRAKAFFTNPWFLRIASLTLFLAAWQYFGQDQPYVISTPTAILQAGIENFIPEVLPAFIETLKGLGAGFGLAILIGIPVGLLMSFSRVAELALSPYVSALYATPRITLIPVLVLALGISFNMRVGIVVLSAVFPILLNTYLGGKEVSPGLMDVGKAFNASKPKIYTSILLRGSVPYIFTGLRLGLARGLMGVVVAEIATSAGGVGNLISYYAKYFRIDSMFVVVVLLGIFALVITEVIARTQTRLTEPWLHVMKKGARA